MPTTHPTSSQIRQQFIDYFVDKAAHTAVPSSPVVPHDDPTLLFTNAGMNQFKDVFLGTGSREYTRAVDTQKCIRAGGKHNDLDDVGKDSYHHTFFEMLGNWSFGDYFKQEAIDWAWDLLVNVWGLDPKRLYATYFEGDASENLEPDHEARDMWLKYLPKDHVQPGNKKDNFWEMGDTGPCGPCSELHYDRSPDYSGANLVNADAQDIVVEIWNLVFIQYNRNQDASLTPLPAKHVDTGMGFERIVRVLQGKDSNYDTDVFTPYFKAIQKITGAPPYKNGEETLSDPTDIAYRVIADHIRTLTFSLADGAHCGNDGRSYVLRSILRRAVKFGDVDLGAKKPFFYKLVDTVVEQMGDFFPELKANTQDIKAELKDEEISFRKTLARGIDLFEHQIREEGSIFVGKDKNKIGFAEIAVQDRVGTKIGTPGTEDYKYIIWNFSSFPSDCRPVLTADFAFKLHDTYGFPIGLTQLMAKERGMTVDTDGFNRLMEEARIRSRAGGDSADERASLNDIIQHTKLNDTKFKGYDATELNNIQTSITIFKLESHAFKPLTAGQGVSAGDRVAIVLDQTPFYAEAGGQVGDTGAIQIIDGARIFVEDTTKLGNVYFHLGEVTDGQLANTTGDTKIEVSLAVDEDRRALIMNNHTTTHLMNRALRDHVNPDTMQKGSLVDEEKLRFDFLNKSSLTTEQLTAVESAVNADIAADLPVFTEYAPQEDALKINGLRAVFGEKYPPTVRVVSVGAQVADLLANPDSNDWATMSIEFCGGTHLPSTGAAKTFTIISEDASSKGIRRITALTGNLAAKAQAEAAELQTELDNLTASADKADPDTLAKNLTALSNTITDKQLPAVSRTQLRDSIESLQKKLRKLQKKQSQQAAGAIADVAKQVAADSTGPIITHNFEGAGANDLRTAMDTIRAHHPDAALFLTGSSGSKVALLASVPKDLIASGLKAGDWVKHVAPIVGGGGGGRPDMAQAGGKDASKLPEAIEAATAFANKKLG
ncbi:Alanine--tRNA ligase [Poriferisphaera corsica]|uniref:Alanine--tRNA ligase n=1 Tax=Poriferisphaera corsica TaxID=2528020 RepID=A0A517YUH2_9BACT|nr:alanine--tRNA ligase [Poriferisphaera corsica]QDU33837.1 Alanine--tRNA ligase [Poriferisphaera corsica]